MNREKFEALPDVKEKLKYHKVVYDEELGKYRLGFNHDPLRVEAAVWLNGAYYAFCEQEKRIERLKDYLIVSCAFTNDYIEELLR